MSAGGRSVRSLRAARWIALLAVAGYVAHALAANRVVDDCYITFRYARNWVAGAGPVFNPPPFERVEGYTNFLWTALIAAVHRVAPGLDLLHVAQALALACGIAIILQVARLAFARRPEAGLLRAFAPLLLALHAPFVLWSTGGLETLLFALLVFAAALAELASGDSGRGRWRAPLLLALATMTRPDGVVFLLALLLFRFWRVAPAAGAAPTREERAAGWKLAAAALLLFALAYLPYWWWRWRYYGRPLPNTFYAKVGSGLAQWKRGAWYFGDWAVENGILLALLPLVPVARSWREPRVRLLALFAAAGLGFVVSVGGDSLGMYRFMVPLAPFFALLAQEGLLDLVERVRGSAPAPARRTAGGLLGGVVIVASLALSAQPSLGPVVWPARFHVTEPQTRLTFPGDGVVHSYVWFDNYFVDRLAVAGRWLDRHAPPDALVASSPAGSIGFRMRQPLLDMLGLNDVHIASEEVPGMGRGRAGHEKGDGPYVLSRKPSYVLLGNVCVFDHPMTAAEIESRSRKLKSERELIADPEFHRLYELRSVPIANGDPELAEIAPENRHLFAWFTFYERRGDAPR